MTQRERRFHQRYRRAISFELERDGASVRALTLNTSAGGAFLRASQPLAMGAYRCWLVDSRGHRRGIGLDFEAIHSVMPGGEPGYGVGGRWVRLLSRESEAVVSGFMESVLGIVGARLRATHEGGVALLRFDFPLMSHGDRPTNGGRGLADLLEPPRPGEPSSDLLAIGEPQRPGLIRRISSLFKFGGVRSGERVPTSSPAPVPGDRGVAEQSEVRAPGGAPASVAPDGVSAGAPGARESSRKAAPSIQVEPPPRLGGGGESEHGESPEDAVKRRRAMRSVPPIAAEVRTPDGKFSAMLARLGSMSMDLASSENIPELYQRVVVTMAVPVGGRSVEVRISGTVTRRKKDRRFTVRYVKVDEGGNQGAFERFVHEVAVGD